MIYSVTPSPDILLVNKTNRGKYCSSNSNFNDLNNFHSRKSPEPEFIEKSMMKECLFTFHRYKVLIRKNQIYRRLGGRLGGNRNNLLHFSNIILKIQNFSYFFLDIFVHFHCTKICIFIAQKSIFLFWTNTSVLFSKLFEQKKK